MSSSLSAASGPIAPRLGAVRRNTAAVLGEGIFADWQRRNLRETVPHSVQMLHEYGHVRNFERLVTGARAPFAGFVFADSDVHKALEALAWMPAGDDVADGFFDHMLGLYEEVQEPDGYLNSAFQGWDATQERWSDFAQGHELYSLGHLIQAGIAAKRAGRGDRLLTVARRFADLACRLFGGDDRLEVPGHPEVEMALVELYRETSDANYLELAKSFIDRRGQGWLGARPHGPYYYQDTWPLRETASLYGHAVRAAYLCAGATDVAMETGDAELLEHLQSLWDDMVATKSYLTGGIGARHRDESFGDAFELPSERAYAETCAAVGLIQWDWRMLLATGDGKYAEHIERVLFNAFAVGLGADGRSFFYSNPLQRRVGHLPSQEEGAGERLPWFHVSCCPPNIMRTMATLQHYLATSDDDGVQVHLPVNSTVSASLPSGQVTLTVTGGYPWNASFTVRIDETPVDAWTLRFRLPAGSSNVHVDGRPTRLVDGYVDVAREWSIGATLEITADLPARRVTADPRVDALRGTSAFVRGPFVYCAESADNVSDLDRLVVPVSAELRLTGDGRALTVEGVEWRSTDQGLYRESWEWAESQPDTIKLVPYFTWGNRTPGAMRIWFPSGAPASVGTGAGG